MAPDYYWGYDLRCPENNPYNDTLACIPKADKRVTDDSQPVAEAQTLVTRLVRCANEKR